MPKITGLISYSTDESDPFKAKLLRFLLDGAPAHDLQTAFLAVVANATGDVCCTFDGATLTARVAGDFDESIVRILNEQLAAAEVFVRAKHLEHTRSTAAMAQSLRLPVVPEPNRPQRSSTSPETIAAASK